jgi:spermidine synthase
MTGAVLILSGAAVMMVEVAAPRLCAPAFGTSIYTWTNVIAVVCVALAAGAWLGGQMAQARDVRATLSRSLLGTTILLLPVPFLSIPLAVWLLPDPEALSPLVASGQITRASLALALLLLAAPLLLLGTVSPLAVRLMVSGGAGSGRAAGRVLSLTTTGGLAGTYLPPHFLFGVVGVRGTVLLAAALLGLAAMLLHPGRRLLAGATATLVLALVLGFVSNRWPIRGDLARAGPQRREVAVLEELDSPYQYVRLSRWEIAEAAGRPPFQELRLSLDEGVTEFHSLLREGEVLTGAYYDFFAVLPSLLEASPIDVAILGGGGGTMAQMLRRLWGGRIGRIVNLEIDPVVAALAPRFGWRPSPADRDFVGDARGVFRSLDHAFDLVILDAYARQVAIPAHLATWQFFREVAGKLSPFGLFAINVSTPDLENTLFRSLVRTLGRVFPAVSAVSVPGAWNVVLLAARESRRFRPSSVPEDLALVRDLFLHGLVETPLIEQGRGLLLDDDHAPLEQLARRR